MNERMAEQLAAAFDRRDDEGLVRRLQSALPDPDAWAAYSERGSSPRLLSLTGDSLFAVTTRGGRVKIARTVVADHDPLISIDDQAPDSDGTWTRRWRIEFRRRPDAFPEQVTFESVVGADPPQALEVLGERIASLTGWDLVV